MNEQEWRKLYRNRLESRGVPSDIAQDDADAAEYVIDMDPIDAADDELSYMMQDSK